MTIHAPIFASEKSAARLLDMATSQFRALVQQGSLPTANEFGRWDVEGLVAIMRGEKIRHHEELDL
jgi:hypothetical protein